VAIALDRQEKATEVGPDGTVRDVDHSAVQYVQNALGLQVCAIARLADLLQYLNEHTATDLSQHRARVLAYRERYGVA
jgi:orotate phosphoribosyltransferase